MRDDVFEFRYAFHYSCDQIITVIQSGVGMDGEGKVESLVLFFCLSVEFCLSHCRYI